MGNQLLNSFCAQDHSFLTRNMKRWAFLLFIKYKNIKFLNFIQFNDKSDHIKHNTDNSQNYHLLSKLITPKFIYLKDGVTTY